jgi:hypothetical protein
MNPAVWLVLLMFQHSLSCGTFSASFVPIKEHPNVHPLLEGLLDVMNLAVLLLLNTIQHELSNSFLLFRQVKNTRKSSQRLKDCLMEMNLAVPLALPISELDYRNFLVTGEEHLKFEPPPRLKDCLI